MLVTFSSDAHADITLFGTEALQLIRMMGRTDTVPGAVLADDVPAALARLKQALKNAPAAADETADNEDDDEEDKVPLATRAFALLQLLQAAVDHKADVMWRH
ncbi:hypothetical protein A8C75_09710 [Marinobacterium aestuarii]|uniref:DUF1840 domain-containing protein n=2 Tax=Marinobacterium aestuarii TaxID=1821621 RepID=A0A1A9F5L4_9GAMM|nr:hypothetical protein A8C75_09710 [Marinobacterium aestuarii]